MTTPSPSQPTPKEKGLMKLASYKNKVIDSVEYKIAQTHRFMLNLHRKGQLTDDDLFEYVAVHGLCIKADSASMGVFSVIDDYTDKKGKTFKAHFTIHGNYLGRVSTLGEEPISYKGHFPIDRNFVKIVNTGTEKELYEVFKLIQE